MKHIAVNAMSRKVSSYLLFALFIKSVLCLFSAIHVLIRLRICLLSVIFNFYPLSFEN